MVEADLESLCAQTPDYACCYPLIWAGARQTRFGHHQHFIIEVQHLSDQHPEMRRPYELSVYPTLAADRQIYMLHRDVIDLVAWARTDVHLRDTGLAVRVGIGLNRLGPDGSENGLALGQSQPGRFGRGPVH